MSAIIMKRNRKNRRIRGIIFPFGLFILLIIMAGCSSEAETSTFDVESEITGKEKEEILGTVNDRIYENVERGDEKGEATILSAIYRGGKDESVPEGRYEIYGTQAGVITIFDEDGEPWLEEVLGTSTETVTVSLLDTDSVHADGGFESVSIAKAEEQADTQLTNGVWEVGEDIKPGMYKMYSESGHGNVLIFAEGEDPRVYEIIGGMVSETETDIYKKVTLEEGELIRITGMANVSFEN